MKNFVKESKESYIECMAMLVASTLKSTYENFENNSGWSYQQVFNSSFDQILLIENEKKKLHQMIVKILNEKYQLKVVSDEKENLFFQNC